LQSCCCSNTRAYFYYIELKQALWTPDIVTGRLFNWCIAMVQYVLMVLIAFTAIDGIDFSLNSDSTSTTSDSELTYDEVDLEELIYSYMEKYLQIAVAFAMLSAALSLNEVFPWTEQVQEKVEQVAEKVEQLADTVQNALDEADILVGEELVGEDAVQKGSALKTFYEEGKEKLEENVEAAKDELGYEEEDDEEEDADAEDADADAKPVNSTTTDEKKMK